MKTLALILSDSQYERLQYKAEADRTSMAALALTAIEAFLRSEMTRDRYARLARKQTLWHIRQGMDLRPQSDLSVQPLVRERQATYAVAPDQDVRARLADLRLDLIYHSEALEGNPLTRIQVKDAIQELSPR